MNNITKETSAYMDKNLLRLCQGFGGAFLSLLSFTISAQDIYLESQTIKLGEEVSYTTIVGIYTGAAFIVESEGYAKLVAGKRIELNPGFKVLDGGRLLAIVLEVNPVIADEPVTSLFAVFPNPTDGMLTITSQQNIDAVRLIDMNGFAVMEQTGINSTDFSMDISTAKPGLYILEIASGKVAEKVRLKKK
jgi:Secretion system C-terminal sorting domain